MTLSITATFCDRRTLNDAIYVLTPEGVMTTNYILNLRDSLDKNHADEWQNDLTGVYLAGALKLLHKDKDAESLIDKFKIDNKTARTYDDFCQPLGANSQYVSVLARQFPAGLRKISAEEFEQILQPIGEGEFNTLSAAYAVQALKVYSNEIAQNLPKLIIDEVDE